ncbi:MAG: hypothetical protein AAFV80_06810 [Bacteroidota bacterium]
MKNVSRFAACLLLPAFLLVVGCGDSEEPAPSIPASTLILGVWTQTIAKEEGVVQQKDEIMEMTFEATGDVTVRELDADNNAIILDVTEDTWTLTDEDSKIDFGFLEDLDILELTDSTLVVEYMGQNQIGQTILKEDTYEQN